MTPGKYELDHVWFNDPVPSRRYVCVLNMGAYSICPSSDIEHGSEN